MSPVVSIIVPVYNAAATLPRCADSILAQEFTDFELLLVDDGSTDGSAALCDRYAAADPRVRVLHQSNSGVSAARNLALEQAAGEWLQFVDSDDWLSPDATRLFVRAGQDSGCDLVISDFYRVVGERLARKGDIERSGAMTRAEFAGEMMRSPADFYYGVLWNKLYRTALVREHGLKMDASISWCEDFMFNLEYLRHARQVYVLRTPIYYYVKTKGSLVSQGTNLASTIRMKRAVFACYNDFYKQILDEDDYSRMRRQVYRFLVDAAGDGIVPPPFFPSSVRLGQERTSVGGASESSGVLAEDYQRRKLLEQYLEPVALKHDLTLGEARLLLFVGQSGAWFTRRELAECAGLSRTTLARSLQRLTGRELIEVEERKGRRDRTLRVTLLVGAEDILTDLLAAQEEYEQLCRADLTDEEAAQYAALHAKVMARVRDALW